MVEVLVEWGMTRGGWALPMPSIASLLLSLTFLLFHSPFLSLGGCSRSLVNVYRCDDRRPRCSSRRPFAEGFAISGHCPAPVWCPCSAYAGHYLKHTEGEWSKTCAPPTLCGAFADATLFLLAVVTAARRRCSGN